MTPTTRSTVFINEVAQQVPTHWPDQMDLVSWCHHMAPGTAAILVVAGIVYLLFGYYAFKVLVTLNAILVAAVVGALIGEKMGSAVAGAIIAGVSVGAVTWPLMKWAVAVMGGLYGAALGASVWRAFDLQASFTWSGAAIGLVFFGLLSFILFRGCVIIYTSLQGSVMLVCGVLGLVYKYDDIASSLTDSIRIKPFILPMAVFIAAMIGLMYQQAQFPAPSPAKK